MNWLISVLLLGAVFVLVRRNLKLTQGAKSVKVFTAFYLFVSAVCLIKMTGWAYFDFGGPFRYLVENLRAVL